MIRTIYGVDLTPEAEAVIGQFANPEAEVLRDVEDIIAGVFDVDSFLTYCLDGADPECVQGWHDYADAVFAAATREVLS